MLTDTLTDEPKMTKEQFKPEYEDLIAKLAFLQQEAHRKEIGLVVLFEGWDGAGKGSRISNLMCNLDARCSSVVMAKPFCPDAESEFFDLGHGVKGDLPIMCEFWEMLGSCGNMTIYDKGWYSKALDRVLYGLDSGSYDFVSKRTRKELRESHAMDPYVETSRRFEELLVDSGYLVVKFFVHVSQKTMERRLERLYSNPITRWRVPKSKIKSPINYKKSLPIIQELLSQSNFDFAPWIILNGEDKRFANLEIARTLVATLEKALDKEQSASDIAAQNKARANSAGAIAVSDPRGRSKEESAKVLAAAKDKAALSASVAPKTSRFKIQKNYPNLDNVDYSLALEQEEYKRELKIEKARLSDLMQRCRCEKIPVVVMYEGGDAAGKGGNIKRIAQAIDSRSYSIFTSPAPTKVELLHPHLWRYWCNLPHAGFMGIYDRSWYGRVLVERVEGFASDDQWARAYDEINQFEDELMRWGAIMIKFWVEVSPDEQLNRFKLREENPLKQWKITDEDWRNRDKAPQYHSAVQDMFRLTSTEKAPWHILESNNKYYARVKALRIINSAIERRLNEK